MAIDKPRAVTAELGDGAPVQAQVEGRAHTFVLTPLRATDSLRHPIPSSTGDVQLAGWIVQLAVNDASGQSIDPFDAPLALTLRLSDTELLGAGGDLQRIGLAGL